MGIKIDQFKDPSSTSRIATDFSTNASCKWCEQFEIHLKQVGWRQKLELIILDLFKVIYYFVPGQITILQHHFGGYVLLFTHHFWGRVWWITLPETNITQLKNCWLEDESFFFVYISRGKTLVSLRLVQVDWKKSKNMLPKMVLRLMVDVHPMTKKWDSFHHDKQKSKFGKVMIDVPFLLGCPRKLVNG